MLPGAVYPVAVTEAKQPRNDQNGLVRIDFNTGRQNIDARYYETFADDTTANGVAQGQGIATYSISQNSAAIHYGNIGDTWVISSNLLNVARIAYKRYQYNISPTSSSSLTSLGADYSQPGPPLLPRVSVSSRTGLVAGTVNNNDSFNVDQDEELDDSVTWSHGRHNVQVGAEYLHLNYVTRFHQSPSLSYSNNFTGVPAADFIAGLGGISVGNLNNESAIQNDLYAYIQDDWRATPRLTINLGLRYELPYPWYQPNGQSATFIPGFQSSVFPTAPTNLAFPGDRGIGKALTPTPYNNFAPRLGFAYNVAGAGRTVLRAGFGVFYDAINALVVGTSEPFHYAATYTIVDGGTSQPLLGLNAIPQDYVTGQTPVFVTPYSITYPDAHFTTPYTMAVNIGIQQRIRSASTVELNYVGRMSRRLAEGFDRNPAIYDCSGAYFQQDPATYCTGANTTVASYDARVRYPNFNFGGKGALDYMTEGSASYNAVQLLFTTRSKSKLTTTASYTYSKSLDDSSNTGIVNSSDQPSISIHHARSDFDSQQILNLGWVYRLPTPNLRFRAASAVIGGWSISGIYNARTGHPFSAVSSTDTTLASEGSEYLNFVPGGYQPLSANRHRAQKVQQWFNTNDVQLTPKAGAYGNVQRNFFTGPAFINTTLSVTRLFAVPRLEGSTFSFRVDAINAFNTPNLGQPSSTLSNNAAKNGSFGVILATVGTNGAVGNKWTAYSTLRSTKVLMPS